MQPLLLGLSCAWMGLKSQTHFPLTHVHLCSLCIRSLKFIPSPHPYNCGLISELYPLWGYDCPSGPLCPLLPPATCVPWISPAHPAPPGPPQGVPLAGRASPEGGGNLSVTGDKDPLDSLSYPMIPLSIQGGVWGVEFTCTHHVVSGL